MHIKTIYDPYDWLPGHGEERVSFIADEADVIIEVIYEQENTHQLLKRNFIFKSVVEFSYGWYPGPISFGSYVDYRGAQYTSLIEVVDSKEAISWHNYIATHKTRCFQIYFSQANMLFRVFAEEACLGEPQPYK